MTVTLHTHAATSLPQRSGVGVRLGRSIPNLRGSTCGPIAPCSAVEFVLLCLTDSITRQTVKTQIGLITRRIERKHTG